MNIVSGIYVISHIKSGKIYLGQARNIRKRWKQHRWALDRGDHGNEYLQRAWSKYGANAFKFQILEYCPVGLLDEREQHYLNIHMPKGSCYNIASDVKNSNRNRKLSDEHKRKISESHKGMKHTEESKRKISENNNARLLRSEQARLNKSLGQMGRIFTEETRRKIGIANSGQFIVVSPDGVEYQITGLSQFCRENNLNSQNMSSVAAGRRLTHKGWKCRKL